jgi:hypothetical protein
MPTNMFSALLDGNVSHTRRVLHSAQNYFQTVHVNPFGDSSSVNLGNLTNVGGQAMNVMGVVAGSAAIGFATGAVATGAFAAAVAGPQAAVTLGVISIAMAVKSAYSNREASHKALSKHVFNMVDDMEPALFTDATLKEAAKAANYLLSEGQNQFELVSSKYQTALAGFNKYLGTLDAKITIFNGPGTPVAKAKAKREATAEFHAAQQPGGAIFQFVRRCSHTGNYLQAPHIMHLAIVEQLTPGKVVGQVGAHAKHFSDAHIVQTSRGMFTALHTKFTDNHGRGKIFA